MKANELPITVEIRKVFDHIILDISIGANASIALTVPEAIKLIRKIEERL